MNAGTIDDADAWSLLCDLKKTVKAGGANWPLHLKYDGRMALMVPDAAGAWRCEFHVTDTARALIDLYLPVCLAGPDRPLTIAHLGQSLDGRIATRTGASHYVTGPENIIHLHRMRALVDAVLVGARTVAADDPQLTTRKVRGRNPIRVIIDPHDRVAPTATVLTDRAAPTIMVRDRSNPICAAHADVLTARTVNGRLDVAELLAGLHGRGMWSVLIEGGGSTVSDFLRAGVLDRLQLTIAPLIIGSGIHGLNLPAIDDLTDAIRPNCRVVPMGDDILFDCRLVP